MKTLKEKDVLRLMREEWNHKVNKLVETVNVSLTSKVAKEGEKNVIAPELKVLHKKSGIRYTIDSIGPRDCILRTPEGEKFLVDASALEKDYEIA